MEYNFYLITILTVILCWLSYYFSTKNTKYPPGPIGIPYFGNLFSVGSAPHLQFYKWAKKYGPVYSVKLGEVNAVILNDVKSIKEAFKEESFSGRPNNKFFLLTANNKKQGTSLSEGNDWVEQRRFVLRSLRDFGFGKNSIESTIMDEVDEFMEWLKSETGNSICLNRRFSLAILNSIWSIACGRRYKHDDPTLKNLIDTLTGTFNQSVKNGFLVFLNKLSMIAPEMSGWNAMINSFKPAFALISKEIQEHDETHVATNYPRDFLDSYLTNIKSTTDPKSSFYKDTGYSHLEAVMMEFFTAGSETTSTTLTWAVLYLAVNPKVQNKMQKEIDAIVGKNKKPSLDDKKKLIYTEAVMNEVLRMSSIVPTGVFHNTMRNVTFQGFEIPKDTYIVSNLYGIHHDPDLWDEPSSFKPERFLSDDGTCLIKPEAFMPFSVGKRVCLGESLARDEFFLFLTNIFQNFEVRTELPIHEVSLEPELGFLLQAKKFNVIMKDRLH